MAEGKSGASHHPTAPVLRSKGLLAAETAHQHFSSEVTHFGEVHGHYEVGRLKPALAQGLLHLVHAGVVISYGSSRVQGYTAGIGKV